MRSDRESDEILGLISALAARLDESLAVESDERRRVVAEALSRLVVAPADRASSDSTRPSKPRPPQREPREASGKTTSFYLPDVLSWWDAHEPGWRDRVEGDMLVIREAGPALLRKPPSFRGFILGLSARGPSRGGRRESDLRSLRDTGEWLRYVISGGSPVGAVGVTSNLYGMHVLSGWAWAEVQRVIEAALGGRRG